MTRIEWTDPAVADLEHIHNYIARDSTDYADALVERLVLAIDRLGSFPESGRRVPESTDPKVRELLVEGYRVMCRLKKRTAQILAVIHGARYLPGMKPKPWATR